MNARQNCCLAPLVNTSLSFVRNVIIEVVYSEDVESDSKQDIQQKGREDTEKLVMQLARAQGTSNKERSNPQCRGTWSRTCFRKASTFVQCLRSIVSNNARMPAQETNALGTGMYVGGEGLG